MSPRVPFDPSHQLREVFGGRHRLGLSPVDDRRGDPLRQRLFAILAKHLREVVRRDGPEVLGGGDALAGVEPQVEGPPAWIPKPRSRSASWSDDRPRSTRIRSTGPSDEFLEDVGEFGVAPLQEVDPFAADELRRVPEHQESRSSPISVPPG